MKQLLVQNYNHKNTNNKGSLKLTSKLYK